MFLPIPVPVSGDLFKSPQGLAQLGGILVATFAVAFSVLNYIPGVNEAVTDFAGNFSSTSSVATSAPAEPSPVAAADAQ